MVGLTQAASHFKDALAYGCKATPHMSGSPDEVGVIQAAGHIHFILRPAIRRVFSLEGFDGYILPLHSTAAAQHRAMGKCMQSTCCWGRLSRMCLEGCTPCIAGAVLPCQHAISGCLLAEVLVLK